MYTLFGSDAAVFAKVGILAVLYSVFLIAFRVLFMLSIGFDCKSNKNQKQAMWMVLTFFFPLIAGIVYACTRNKPPVNATKVCGTCGAVIDGSMTFCPHCGNSNFVFSDNTTDMVKHKRTANVLFGVSVGSFVIAVILYCVFAFNIFSVALDDMPDSLDGIDIEDFDFSYGYNEKYGYTDEKGNTVYYDRLGNAYNESEDVLYYDAHGNVYTYEADEFAFESANDVEHYEDYCYVDADGYFYIDVVAEESDSGMRETISYDENTGYYADKDGNTYYLAYEISWDKDGNLVDSYTGDILENEINKN